MTLLKLLLLGAYAGAIFSCGASNADTPAVVDATPVDTLSMVRIEDPAGAFYMDLTEVTTGDFRRFIAATAYVTEADSYGWSGVFSKEQQTWIPVTGANWAYPNGPDAKAAPADQPVTQVSYLDARRYAEWAGKQLPTEEQWMYAATQGGKFHDYPWGEEMLPGGTYRGNWWQGPFPSIDEVRDGFAGVAAVAQFPAAENGLYDMAGNVWEWTSSERKETGEVIIKGGSFLCSTSYCTGFNLQQKQYTAKDSGLNHLGFRCIRIAAK